MRHSTKLTQSLSVLFTFEFSIHETSSPFLKSGHTLESRYVGVKITVRQYVSVYTIFITLLFIVYLGRTIVSKLFEEKKYY